MTDKLKYTSFKPLNNITTVLKNDSTGEVSGLVGGHGVLKDSIGTLGFGGFTGTPELAAFPLRQLFLSVFHVIPSEWD